MLEFIAKFLGIVLVIIKVTKIMSSMIASSLPNIEAFISFNNDDDILKFINSIMKLIQIADKSPSDFSFATAWTVKLIYSKADNKEIALYRIGLIYLQKYIGINITTIANIFGVSMQQIEQMIKSWTVVNWDTNEKMNILQSLDQNASPQSWQLFSIDPTDSIMIAFNTYSPNVITDIPDEVPEPPEIADVEEQEPTIAVETPVSRNDLLAPILPTNPAKLRKPKPKPSTQANTDKQAVYKPTQKFMIFHNLGTQSIIPIRWAFDTQPAEKYEF